MVRIFLRRTYPIIISAISNNHEKKEAEIQSQTEIQREQQRQRRIELEISVQRTPPIHPIQVSNVASINNTRHKELRHNRRNFSLFDNSCLDLNRSIADTSVLTQSINTKLYISAARCYNNYCPSCRSIKCLEEINLQGTIH
jgi:hypothetical protein